MFPEIIYTKKTLPDISLVIIGGKPSSAFLPFLAKEEIEFLRKNTEVEEEIIIFSDSERYHFYVPGFKNNKKPTGNEYPLTGVEKTGKELEQFRKAGFHLQERINGLKKGSICILSFLQADSKFIAFLEGLILSNYQFNKYHISADHKPHTLKKIYITGKNIKKNTLTEYQNLWKGVFTARDLVNEPVSYLDSEKLAEEIKSIAGRENFDVKVLDKKEITKSGMGGILSVNKGSIKPPTFSILEWKPSRVKNKKPYILIGKGIVFDTGGLSLKPTPQSMDCMKSDMAGAAAVVGIFRVLSANKIPLHVIGLIPSTDNRPGGDAYAPGDVITIMDGTTVEVLNTDAEGRLILADALCFARRYNPELVIDMATLTGAASRAVSKEGIVCMGTALSSVKKTLYDCGFQVYERLVEFPVWEEYKEYIKSDIADLKNIGGPDGGAITAGKFLQYFVRYPWIHLDIAPCAYNLTADSYRGKNATGVCVRLLYAFFKRMCGKLR